MVVRPEAAGRQNPAFAGNDLGTRPDDDIDLGLRIRIAGLADTRDAPALEGDIGLHDAPVVDDQGIGDDGIGRTGRVRHLTLAHAVANDLAAAELHLLAIGGEIALDLDEKLGIGQPDAVTDRRAEHMGV
jgi:hypothetical protein